MKKNKNILVVAITRMGDMLQGSPTLAGLKRENPDSKVTVLIDKQFAKICSGIPGIDEVYVVDLSMVVRCIHHGGGGIVEAYRYVDKMVEDLRGRKFDYVFNMSSSPYTALLLKMIDAPESRGWMADEEGFRLITDPWAMLFSAFVYHSNREYNAINLVDIVRCAAGVKDHPERLIYTPTEEERGFAKELIREKKISGKGPLIGIQAGASQTKRQWPPAAFAKVTQLLIDRLDARIVFVGSLSEEWIYHDVAKLVDSPNLASAMGKTTFGELAGVLEQLDVLITGDTGPMHMAVAVGKPVVAIFLASALCFETGPYGNGNIVLQPQISCNPCNPNYPCSRPDCHAQITPEMVAAMTELRLKTPLDQRLQMPDGYAAQSEVAIYCTEFDSDGFLVFRHLAGSGSRNGRPASYFTKARESYKALWKEEFASLPFPEFPWEEGTKYPEVPGISEAIALCKQGSALMRELSDLVQDPGSVPSRLKDVNLAVQQVDVNLEEIGLSFPVLGALIRIFLMEKENLRGDDILRLASETTELYQNLARRGRRFSDLFNYFESRASAAGPGQGILS